MKEFCSIIRCVIFILGVFFSFLNVFARIEMNGTLLRCSSPTLMLETPKLRHEIIECRRKIRIALTIVNDETSLHEVEYLFLDNVYDPEIKMMVKLMNPITIMMKREPLILAYPFFYSSSVNAKVSETVLNKKNRNNYTGCIDNDVVQATCGVKTENGIIVPFSQGFCCSCKDLNTTVHPRGGQNCTGTENLPYNEQEMYLTSAHCLHFNKIWYTVSSLLKPVIKHNVHIQVFVRHDSNKNSHLWMDITKKQSFVVSPDNPYQFNDVKSIIVAYLTKRPNNADITIKYTDKFLLIPQEPPNTDPNSLHQALKNGGTDYLLFDKDIVKPDGNECNTAGVSYAAFVKQRNRCQLPINTGSYERMDTREHYEYIMGVVTDIIELFCDGEKDALHNELKEMSAKINRIMKPEFKPLYSQVLVSKKPLPTKEIIFIEPEAQKDDPEKTKRTLKEKINPKKLRIRIQGVRKLNKGRMLIEEKLNSGRKGSYMLQFYGKPSKYPILFNKTSGEHWLALKHQGYHISTVYIEINADSIIVLRTGKHAQLTSIFTITSNTNSEVTVQLTNTGLVPSRFAVKIVNCNIEVLKNPEKSQMLPAQHTYRYNLIIRFKNFQEKGIFTCVVEASSKQLGIVAMREILLKPFQKCFCQLYCECSCSGNYADLTCHAMDISAFHLAGFRGSIPLEAKTKRVKLWKSSILLAALVCMFIFGGIKALLGLCYHKSFEEFGLSPILFRRKHLAHYYEPELRKEPVIYDEKGYPINPKTKEKARTLPNWTVCFLNVIFFLVSPILLVMALMQLCQKRKYLPLSVSKIKFNIIINF
ncbi:uncharacterized protein LOC111619793 [Centruroides sculpturatus]|uniref:uncharacterized protein LOC111619793 n=1 Tax=Centruroides sculpturatus TaxID=218467 RepID=UPI000C6E6A90|nr:uncharacterized protein LOC111619793 [Centruroides sculpturatus]